MILVKRELTNSDTQLTNDFGEYPLRCFANKEDRFNDFYIVRNSQFNRKLNDLMVIVRGFKSGEIFTLPEAKQARSEFRLSMSATKTEMHAALYDIKSQVLNLLQNNSDSRNIYSRATPYVIIPILALFFLVFAACIIPYLAFRLIKIAIFRIAPRIFGKTISTGALGAFVAIGYNGILEIRLFKPFRTRESDPSEEAIISHEHLHLLQHVNFSEGKKFFRRYEPFRGENTERLKRYLKDPEYQFELNAYYFDLKEMEARLHEFVLSFYQSNHSLPVSQIRFQEMLLSAESTIGKFARALLTEHDVSKPTAAGTYSVRSERTEIELVNIMFRLKNEATIRRFLVQVLPVMYANLLVLYGYVDQAKNFMGTVECKDLFLEMYGASAIPKPLQASDATTP